MPDQAVPQSESSTDVETMVKRYEFRTKVVTWAQIPFLVIALLVVAVTGDVPALLAWGTLLALVLLDCALMWHTARRLRYWRAQRSPEPPA